MNPDHKLVQLPARQPYAMPKQMRPVRFLESRPQMMKVASEDGNSIHRANDHGFNLSLR